MPRTGGVGAGNRCELGQTTLTARVGVGTKEVEEGLNRRQQEVMSMHAAHEAPAEREETDR
eukprot:10191389-Prorocentrum_lima.AAC.1